MRKSALATLVAVTALALALASAAAADPPTRTFAPATAFSGPFCPNFDVGVTPLINNEYTTTFSTGAQIVTGRLVVQVTNLSTGKSVIVNASGPGQISSDGNIIAFGGASLLVFPADFLYPGSPPATWLTSGRLILDFSR